jgi:hypothetical protein
MSIKIMKNLILLSALLSTSAFAWDGYDYDSGNYVEIDKGNLVRQGKDIEYYDYGSGQYKEGEVQSIRNRGSNVEVEVQDRETGKLRTFEMKRK